MVDPCSLAKPLERGKTIAEALKGAWRHSPPSLSLNAEELSTVADALLQRGTGALVWWKLSRHMPAPEFQDAYRINHLHALLQEKVLEKTISALRNHGVEPLLIKGLAVARLYPDIGLRPWGDIDLQIDPNLMDDALAALREVPEASDWVDLHSKTTDLSDRSFQELVGRSQWINVGEMSLRVLGVEDQLRLLCVHFARHGGWRPIWLCDIAAYLESLPESFDWDVFWSGDPRFTAWTRVVLELAIELLDVQMTTENRFASTSETDWLASVVLKEWGSKYQGDSHSRDSKSMAHHLLWPNRLATGIRCRIPNAMELAFKRGLFPSQGKPAGWHQVVYSLDRAPIRPSPTFTSFTAES